MAVSYTRLWPLLTDKMLMRRANREQSKRNNIG